MGVPKSDSKAAGAPAAELYDDDDDDAPRQYGWLVKSLVIGGLLFGGWLISQQSSSFRVAAPVSGSPASVVEDSPAVPVPARDTPPPPIPAESAKSSPAAEPPTETRRALPVGSAPEEAPVTIDEKGVTEVLNALASATTTEERLKLVADPSQNRRSVEAFFKKIDGKLTVTNVQDGHRYTDLATGRETVLYRLTTPTCPEGVIVHLRGGPDGSPRIDWPLFEQSHDKHFDKFIPADSPEKSQRFILVMQRSRDFSIPVKERDFFDSFYAQGSMTAEGGQVRVHVSKDSVTGRLLNTRMGWGKTYLVEALLTHSEIGGKPALVVLELKDGIGDVSK